MSLATIFGINPWAEGASVLNPDGMKISGPLEPKSPHFPAKAKHIIHIFASGGPTQVDTWDPKPQLTEFDAIVNIAAHGQICIEELRSYRNLLERQGFRKEAKLLNGILRKFRTKTGQYTAKVERMLPNQCVHTVRIKSGGTCLSSSKTSSQGICTCVPPTFPSDTNTEPVFLFSILNNQRDGTATAANYSSSKSQPTTTSSRAFAMNLYSVSKTRFFPTLNRFSKRMAGNPNNAKARTFQSRFTPITSRTEN